MAAKSLSLVQKDSFFTDPFFQDAWTDFDTAVQQVLNKYDTQGLTVDTTDRSKTTDLYRQIRSTKIRDDLYASQALQVTEKDGKFQAVMDVKDFNPTDLQVRVVDDRVVVEGKYEKKSEGEGSASLETKCFYKDFNLPPAADIDQVATALSKDGVLTIKAPKKEGGAVVPAPSGALSNNSSSFNQSSSSAKSSSVVKDGSSATSSSVQKSSFSSSSSSSFSSSSSSSVQKSSSNSASALQSGFSGIESMDDMAKDMKDRLVFSHESVNLTLPEKK